MLPLLAPVMLEFSALSGVVLRVWWLSLPVKALNSSRRPRRTPPPPRSCIEMTDEVGERHGLTVFLPHEQQGKTR